jgi:ribulose-phosphate 3-epimerase
LPAVLPKLEALRAGIDRRGLSVDLEVDGGVSPETARRVVSAGANVLVAGSAVFGQKDRKKAIDAIRVAATRVES